MNDFVVADDKSHNNSDAATDDIQYCIGLAGPLLAENKIEAAL